MLFLVCDVIVDDWCLVVLYVLLVYLYWQGGWCCECDLGIVVLGKYVECFLQVEIIWEVWCILYMLGVVDYVCVGCQVGEYYYLYFVVGVYCCGGVGIVFLGVDVVGGYIVVLVVSGECIGFQYVQCFYFFVVVQVYLVELFDCGFGFEQDFVCFGLGVVGVGMYFVIGVVLYEVEVGGCFGILVGNGCFGGWCCVGCGWE